MEEILNRVVGYIRGMWRFRWWGLAVAWVVGLIAGLAIYSIPDRYESSARVFVDTQSVLRPLMSGLAVQPNVNQQIAILSRTLISRPNVEKLISMADLDITVQNEAQREALIANLMSELKIRGTGRDNLFTLAYQDKSPERAQRVVQALVSLFVESGLVGKRQDSDAARRFIEEQIVGYERKLAEAENRLKEFRLRNMTLLGDGGRDYVAKIGDLTGSLSQAELELREAEQARDSLRRQLSGEDPVLLPQEQAQQVAMAIPELDGRIEALRRALDGMRQRFTDDHPDVIGARRVLAQLEEEKKQEVAKMGSAGVAQFGAINSNPVFQQMRMSLGESEARVAGLNARVDELKARLEQLRASAQMLPQLEAEQAQLDRDYNVHKRNYEALVARRESAAMSVQMSSQGGIADFRVIDPPSLPSAPAAPNRMVLMPLAGVAAILVGLALAFVLAQLRPAFSEQRLLREITGLPVLGSVSLLASPAVVRARLRGMLAFGGGVASFVAAVGVMTVALQIMQR